MFQRPGEAIELPNQDYIEKALLGIQHQLWHLAYPSGAAQRVTHDLNFYLTVGLTADARTLVTVQGGELCSLWVAPNGEAKRARQFTSRTSKYEGMGGVAWTPDVDR